MLSWFLPGDLGGWVIIAGMIGLLIAAVLLTHPLTRMALAMLAALALSWQVHHKGVITERARWEAKAQKEAARQDAANREATLEAERDIAERKRQLDLFERDLHDLQREVEAGKGAGDIVLDRDDIQRLNRLRGR
jgi:uncharacterized membrane protein